MNKKQAITLNELLKVDNYVSFEAIVKNLPFLLFLALLATIYIWNTHYMKRNVRQINDVADEVKELRWEYTTTKAELTNLSKQSELAKLVEPIGLKELKEQPKKIFLRE